MSYIYSYLMESGGLGNRKAALVRLIHINAAPVRPISSGSTSGDSTSGGSRAGGCYLTSRPPPDVGSTDEHMTRQQQRRCMVREEGGSYTIDLHVT